MKSLTLNRSAVGVPALASSAVALGCSFQAEQHCPLTAGSSAEHPRLYRGEPDGVRAAAPAMRDW